VSHILLVSVFTLSFYFSLAPSPSLRVSHSLIPLCPIFPSPHLRVAPSPYPSFKKRSPFPPNSAKRTRYIK
jgi:hypothetical protein